MNIALVDDHLLFRKGMRLLLQCQKDMVILFEASNGLELLEQLIYNQPDVILLDLQMPLMGGSEALELVKEKYPKIKIIILTMFEDEKMIIELIEKGANGFLTKESNFDEVIESINGVIKNGHFLVQRYTKILLQNIGTKSMGDKNNLQSLLSSRELEIIKLICLELTNKEIADKLCLSYRTIDFHRSNILQKINAKNTVGIVVFAIKNQIFSWD